jgi:hypothetical protein
MREIGLSNRKNTSPINVLGSLVDDDDDDDDDEKVMADRQGFEPLAL